MDPGDFTQMIVILTGAMVMGRIGLALARMIERRSAPPSGLAAESEERIRAVEDECLTLRREIAELQERQDFAERALLHDPARPAPAVPPARPDRIVTPS
jgi:hypothetical protein